MNFSFASYLIQFYSLNISKVDPLRYVSLIFKEDMPDNKLEDKMVKVESENKTRGSTTGMNKGVKNVNKCSEIPLYKNVKMDKLLT